MANRHLSRSIVLQTLFEWDFTPIDKKSKDITSDKIKDVLKRNLKEFAPGFEDDIFDDPNRNSMEVDGQDSD